MTTKRVILQNASPEALAAFWSYVDRSGGPDACWMWMGSRATPGRYGVCWGYDGKRYRAHRWIYAQVVGIKDHQNDIDHVCHTRDESCTVWDECEHHGCVNPAHLEEVTPEENKLRGRSILADNKRKTHCPQGHPYDDENTAITRRGGRICRECHRTAVRNKLRLVSGIPLDAPVGDRPSKTHCKWGHERLPENLYATGQCRLCVKRRNDAKPRNGLHNVRPKKTHCKWGHEYTPENTYVQDGRRSCITCRRDRTRVQNAKRKAA